MLRMVTYFQFQHTKAMKMVHGNKEQLLMRSVVLLHLFQHGSQRTVSNVTNVPLFVLTLQSVHS